MATIKLNGGDIVTDVITTGQTYYPLDEPFTVPESGIYVCGVRDGGKPFIDPTCHPDIDSALKAISEWGN